MKNALGLLAVLTIGLPILVSCGSGDLFTHPVTVNVDNSALADLLTTKPLSVKVDYASTQFAQTASPWVFPLYFPKTAAQQPNRQYASWGNWLGATLVVVNIRPNKPIYISGVRIEDVRYRPANANVFIDYIHPTLGEITPVFAHLATSFDYSNGYGALPMMADVDNVFEVGLSSELGLWDHIDYNVDGTAFRTDDDEVINVSCSLFFEGFLEDGTEFSGSFPLPLHLDLALSHADPTP
jgi:hypothetical protein